MRNSDISNSKRSAACIMGIMMLVAVLFSSFYIAAESDHDCTGDDCPVCICLQQCENILNHTGDADAFTAAASSAIFLILLACVLSLNLTHATPVSRKIRLNN